MNTVLTLCRTCAEDFQCAPGVRIKKLAKTTTEKKPFCEACRRKGRFFEQYHVQSGR